MAREAAQLAAGSITVFIETDKFKPGPQYAKAVAMTVAPKSDSTIKLRDLALSCVAKVLRSGFRYRLAGATLGGLELVERVLMRLWENEGYERHRRLMAAIDRVNAKFGWDAVWRGLFQSEGIWRTRFGWRSPRYAAPIANMGATFEIGACSVCVGDLKRVVGRLWAKKARRDGFSIAYPAWL